MGRSLYGRVATRRFRTVLVAAIGLTALLAVAAVVLNLFLAWLGDRAGGDSRTINEINVQRQQQAEATARRIAPAVAGATADAFDHGPVSEDTARKAISRLKKKTAVVAYRHVSATRVVEVIKPIVEYEKKAKIAFQIPYGEADLYFTVSYSRSGARWTATVTDPQGSRTPPAGTADTGA